MRFLAVTPGDPSPGRIYPPAACASGFLHLREVEFDGRGTPEDLHRHLQAVLLVIDIFDHAAEIIEGTIGHPHDFARLEDHLRPRLLDAFLNAPQNLIGLAIRDRKAADMAAALGTVPVSTMESCAECASIFCSGISS